MDIGLTLGILNQRLNEMKKSKTEENEEEKMIVGTAEMLMKM